MELKFIQGILATYKMHRAALQCHTSSRLQGNFPTSGSGAKAEGGAPKWAERQYRAGRTVFVNRGWKGASRSG